MGSKLTRLLRLPGLAVRIGRVSLVLCGYAASLGGAMVAAKFRSAPSARAGDRWVRLLTALGPSYVKMGQLLSTRRDLVPETVCDALGRLTDSVPPPSERRIERSVRRAYRGRPWPFAEFEWTPIASGSIATVHRAVTVNGDRVAVKVRRPGIDRMMRQDFEMAAMLAGLLSILPKFRSMPFKVMQRQVGAAILRQLDFGAERDSLGSLCANLAGFGLVRIPAPYPELCTEETVVMEYIGGLRRFSRGELDAGARREVVRAVLAAVYEMLFVDGVVHCDLHPGNLYFDRDANLVILDAGFVVRLPNIVRASFADFFINMAMGNGRMCAEIVIESATQIARKCDLYGFRLALAELVESVSGVKSGDFSLARFAGRLFDLQRRFGLYPVPEFAFPLLALLVVEGMIKGFDSGVDFQAEAIPVLRRRNTARAVL